VLLTLGMVERIYVRTINNPRPEDTAMLVPSTKHAFRWSDESLLSTYVLMDENTLFDNSDEDDMLIDSFYQSTL
jgi:hypothetical protein